MTSAREDAKPEPVSMGIIVNFTDRTVQGFGSYPVKITAWNDVSVEFSGSIDHKLACRAIIDAAARPRETVRVIRQASGAISVSIGGHATQAAGRGGNGSCEGPDGELVGWLPALYPDWLGDRGFLQAHGVRFPSTPRLVVAMARPRMLGFFEAAGLSFDAVQAGLDEIIRTVGGATPLGSQPDPLAARAHARGACR